MPRLAAQAFPRAFVVAWAHACPRSQVPRLPEAAHVGPNLCEDDYSQSPLDPWDRLQTLELCLKGAQSLRDLSLLNTAMCSSKPSI
jgi:hypothetical protein